MKERTLKNFAHIFSTQKKLITFTLIAVLLTTIAYIPSLSGPFMLDDAINLQSLSVIDGEPSVDNIWRYINQHSAGPLGRPLARLSFAVNAQEWPTKPRPFRITNLILHFLVACALFWLVLSVTSLHYSREESYKLALLSAVIWTIHPLNVSTTAYIVQRMTQLSAFFSFLSLSFYIIARRSEGYEKLKMTRNYAACFICMVTGLLCKENTAIIPALILLTEKTVLSRLPKNRMQRYGFIVLSAVPCGAIIVASPMLWEPIAQQYILRDFSLTERLLTQLTVIRDYLSQIFFPNIEIMGVFQDDYPVYRSIFQISTALSATLIASLIGMAIAFRKRHPFYSFSIGFFFVGHLIESTVVPLEIYFEHRNYLPMSFLIAASLLAIRELLGRISENSERLFIFIYSSLFVCLFTLTFTVSQSWGSLGAIIQKASEHHPESRRVVKYVTTPLMLTGNSKLAQQIFLEYSRMNPDSDSWPVEMRLSQCEKWLQNDILFEDFRKAYKLLQDSNALGFIIRDIYRLMGAGVCKLDSKQVKSIYQLTLEKEELTWLPFQWGRASARFGSMFKLVGDTEMSVEAFQKATENSPDDEQFALHLAIALMENGNIVSARAVAQKAYDIHIEKGARSRLNPKSVLTLYLIIEPSRETMKRLL